MSASAEEVKKHIGLYWGVFGALLVLTAVTVGVGFYHLPMHYAIIVCLVIALTKGSLVAGYFMHLIGEKKVIYWVLALTVFFFFLVLLLPVITVQEDSVAGSMWSPAPAGAVPAEAPATHE